MRVSPEAPVLEAFSEPARSTINNWEEENYPFIYWQRLKINIRCDLDDSEFIIVFFVYLILLACYIIYNISSGS